MLLESKSNDRETKNIPKLKLDLALGEKRTRRLLNIMVVVVLRLIIFAALCSLLYIFTPRLCPYVVVLYTRTNTESQSQTQKPERKGLRAFIYGIENLEKQRPNGFISFVLFGPKWFIIIKLKLIRRVKL